MQISEAFYSCQCEGISTGVPSVFIRLANCNLECGSTKAALAENAPTGQLVQSGEATWCCDTIPVWRKGVTYSVQELTTKIAEMQDGLLPRIFDGQVHLIWTGGEPTLTRNCKDIMAFLDYLHLVGESTLGPAKKLWYRRMFNEIETNGTVQTPIGFYGTYIQQINCSPKLANSGMSKFRRINSDALVQIDNFKNSQFKFVISKEEDIHEMEEDFIAPLGLDRSKIVLMPGVDNRAELAERTEFLYNMCKKYYYRGVTRTHILAWDKVTGV